AAHTLGRTRLALVLGITAQIAHAQTAAPAAPTHSPASKPSVTTSAGFSAERLARIDRTLEDYVEKGQLAGAVALVLRDGRPVYSKAVGWADKEAGRRMTADTVFRIASQTKAL